MRNYATMHGPTMPPRALAGRPSSWRGRSLQELVQALASRRLRSIAALDRAFRHLLVAQAEGEIVVDGHVLIERVVSGTPWRSSRSRWRQVVDHALRSIRIFAARDVLQALRSCARSSTCRSPTDQSYQRHDNPCRRS